MKVSVYKSKAWDKRMIEEYEVIIIGVLIIIIASFINKIMNFYQKTLIENITDKNTDIKMLSTRQMMVNSCIWIFNLKKNKYRLDYVSNIETNVKGGAVNSSSYKITNSGKKELELLSKENSYKVHMMNKNMSHKARKELMLYYLEKSKEELQNSKNVFNTFNQMKDNQIFFSGLEFESALLYIDDMIQIAKRIINEK